MERGARISVAIPASITSDTPHLREKTSKIGLVGRAAAVFKVDELIIYNDNPMAHHKTDARLIATLLAYMETPQYLRRKLFKLDPDLRYAGILPPLRTPHHPLNRKMKDLKIGEYRDGIVISQDDEGVLIDVGTERPVRVMGSTRTVGQRVTVKIIKVGAETLAHLERPEEVPLYWGYKVINDGNTLGRIIKNRNFDLVLFTSKYGTPFADLVTQISQRWDKARTIIVAFGAPAEGLDEILKRERLEAKNVSDFVINTVPSQGTETVRTEEALLASLAVLNVMTMLKA